MSGEDSGFGSKNWVWVPDGKGFFAKGYVTDYAEDSTCKVTVVDGNQEVQKVIKNDELQSCNPSKFNKCDDMAELTHLNEPSVVYNLFLRYNDNLIYTYSGLFLVAINPYKSLPIYDNKTLKRYNSPSEERLPPHIFATAEGTYRNLLKNVKDQSILVTGESGAGKTENTKKIIQYLSSITPESRGGTKSVTTTSHSIDSKILQANPILESFGNAKTIKNNNSSRFGKFIKIFFSSNGRISGANIEYYLLEKSRVVHQSQGERNYHVFYQFLNGCDDKMLKKFSLERKASQFKYIGTSGTNTPNTDDKRDFNLLLNAFEIMELSNEEVECIFSVLAVVLHLGNLEFKSWKSEQATFKDDSPVDIISSLLGVKKDDFIRNMLSPEVKAGRETVRKHKKAPEAKYAVDALAKYLYEKIFNYIIQRINDNLKIDDSLESLNFIGVLDIAGFEIFQQNSFEQLCINYTNEKLQQFFNHHSFILEQSEYLREDIEWEFIDFGLDLQPTIDLIEMKQPMGVLEILNEECMLPKSTDKGFMDKLAQSWGKGKSRNFRENKFKNGFIINHYAGEVEYNVTDWLQKNADPVNENVLKLLPKSTNAFILKLFEDDVYINNSKRKPKTASHKHKEQLYDLMEQLGSTEPHFVRCILPNLEKRPNKLDKPLVLHQLRCNGVLEGIRITRAGYPNRMTFDDFFLRYAILNKKEVFTKNARTNSELILKHIELDKNTYKVGITKIFFKNGILGKLEEMRDLTLKSLFTNFQSVIRGKLARSLFTNKINEIRSSQLIAKTFIDVHDSAANNIWFKLFVKVKPLLEESVKMLDSKEVNENLKTALSNLKDAEKLKNNLETENGKLRMQVEKLEKDINAINDVVDEQTKLITEAKQKEAELNGNLKELREKLSSTDKEKESATKEKGKLKKLLDSLILRLEEKEKLIDNLNKESETTNLKISSLNATIRELEEHKLQHESLVSNLKDEHAKSIKLHTEKVEEAMKEKSLIESTLQKQIKGLESIVPQNKSINEELTNLKKTLTDHEKSLNGKDVDIKGLNNIVKKHESTISLLKDQVKEYESKCKSLEKELDYSRSQISEHKATQKGLLKEKETLSKKIEELEALKTELQVKVGQENLHLEKVEILKNKVAEMSVENKDIHESFNSLKAKYDIATNAKNEFSEKIVTLSRKIEELEKSSKVNGKENIPPDTSFRNDYASMKLKLNEQSAFLRKEKLENKKLAEELQLLKSRGSTQKSLEEHQHNRRSIALGEDISNNFSYHGINEEIESLKIQLEQEQANSHRAEKYAIDLQKQLNRLKSSKGNDAQPEFEKKLRESESRANELERKLEDIFSGDATPGKLSKSESYTRGLPIFGSNQDFIKIYQDINGTLKITRQELATAKSEILRLKSLLRDSEDELYDVKRSSFKSSMSNYENEISKLKLKYDSLMSRNSDLMENLEIYRERSDKYYKQLELAESAVSISKQNEESAYKELAELKNQLTLTRDECRASQGVIKSLRLEISTFEERLNDSNFQKEQLKVQIKELKDKITYQDRTLNNRRLNENYKDEIKTLHSELNFKMETETQLIKENKRLQLDFEDLLKEREVLVNELSSKEHSLQETENICADLTKKLRVLDNEKVVHERKINNLSKQVTSLKGLISDLSYQRDELLESKASLELLVDELNQKVEEQATAIHQFETETSILRLHLENQRLESSELRSELSQSKVSAGSDIQDYQKLKREILVTTGENDSLKKVNGELNRKVKDLEEKLYDDEHLKYWENKVANLTTDLDTSRSENHESRKMISSLERKIKELEIRVENESHLTKKYNDENFDYQNKISHFKSTIDILQSENHDKDLTLKMNERQIQEYKEKNLMFEREILELRDKLGIDS